MREENKTDNFSTLSADVHQYLDRVGRELDEWVELYKQRAAKGGIAVPALINYHEKAESFVMGLRGMGFKVYNSEFPDYAQLELLEPIAALLERAEGFYGSVDEAADTLFERSDAALASFAGDGITLDIQLPVDILIDGEVPEVEGLDKAEVLRLNCGLDCCLTINGANIRFQRLLHGPKNSVAFFIDMPADVRFCGKPLDEETQRKETVSLGVQEKAAITVNGVDVTLFSAYPEADAE